MSAHTPGPWDVDERGGGVVRSTAREAGQQYARGWGQPQVALAVGLPETRPPGEQSANAHLIAAAPELLEALEALEAHLTIYPGSSESCRETALGLCDSARAAIAKARGGT